MDIERQPSTGKTGVNLIMMQKYVAESWEVL